MSLPERTGRAVLVLTTTADEESARALSRALVEERLAACATRSAVRSVYRWEPGAAPADAALCEDEEVMIVVKTSGRLADRVEARILELHPYDCPEVVRIEPERVDPAYLAWLLGAVGDG